MRGQLSSDTSYHGRGYKLGMENPTLSKSEVRVIFERDYSDARNGSIGYFFSGFNSAVEKQLNENPNMCKVGKKVFRNTLEAEQHIEDLQKESWELYDKLKEVLEVNVKQPFNDIVDLLKQTEIKKRKVYEDGWYKVTIGDKFFCGIKRGNYFYCMSNDEGTGVLAIEQDTHAWDWVVRHNPEPI